ncbi:MAG: tRNA (cytidine(34)-2'-O)-methyltransferase [Spirochaetia bacterium]|nr:tRNA (cytidine(34)-2'-O)-methyltransferase [Spirochaetia bacterium]
MINFSIALYKPQIPPNTGNISRLCVALDCDLHIVGKTPIRWDEPTLRRAGLDHWNKLRFEHYPSFKVYYQQNQNRRMIAVTKEASTSLWDFHFQKNDILLFGNETMGLPPKLLKVLNHSLGIPMWGESVRSLNLSNSAAIVAYEAYRQFTNQSILQPNTQKYKRTYFKQK